ncbi:MAG: PAS domain S-box protein [Burkholderiaceae bacterium]
MTEPSPSGSPPGPGPHAERDDRRYRWLVDSVRDYAIFMLDTHGRVASWNIGARLIKGYEAHEIIGQSFERFYTPEAVASGWPAEELRRASLHGRLEDEGWRVRKDGSRFWASVVISAQRDDDGRLVGFAKVTRDLTERKREEEALRRSEEQLRLLVGAIQDAAIFLVGVSGLVMTWNAGAHAILGHEAPQALGMPYARFFLHDAADTPRAEHQLATALRLGRFEGDGWCVARDGRAFWAHTSVVPVRDERALHGYAVVLRDLTAQRRLAELESSSSRMNEFIATLAHELRNPLTPISNAAIYMKLQGPLAPPLTRIQAILERQSEQLIRLVDDLLDVGRTVADKITLQLRPTDLHDVLRACVEAARAEAAGAQLHLGFVDEAGGPTWVHGDAARLSQAFANVLNNALRYTPPHGRITVHLGRSAGKAVVRVSDTGLGIAEDALERIFGMFVQGDGAPRTPRQRQGLGIGLALARRIVQLHGGTLVAASPGPGMGSTFTFSLPLSADEGPADREAGDAPAAGGRVLVVDGSTDSADSLAEVLQSLGQTVRTAYGTETALDAARYFQPDIVLLDLGLPGDGARALARTLRGEFGRRVYLAAVGAPPPPGQPAPDPEPLDVRLTKPVGVERLRQLLRDALALRPPR